MEVGNLLIIMKRGTFHDDQGVNQGNRIILNGYTPNHNTSNEVRTEVNLVIVGEFNTPLSVVINRASK